MEETWILYQTTNLINGKLYIGVHKVVNTALSKRYLGSGDRIKAAIKKYGRENFVRKTLVEFKCFEDAYAEEAKVVTKEFVKRLDTYNICLGGKGGVNLTEEMKNKISKANSGKIRSVEHSAKLSAANKGRTHSEEAKVKISIAGKGRIKSEETRAKLSAANKGKKLSKEHIEKLRAASLPKHVPVVINGKYYEGIRFAARAENILTHKTVRDRVKSTNPKWSGWRYATEEEKRNYMADALQ
jgi:group I intron endonuclease